MAAWRSRRSFPLITKLGARPHLCGSRLCSRFSVAIPVATRGQALAFRGTSRCSSSARASSPGTPWRGLAGMVTDSPLPPPPALRGRRLRTDTNVDATVGSNRSRNSRHSRACHQDVVPKQTPARTTYCGSRPSRLTPSIICTTTSRLRGAFVSFLERSHKGRNESPRNFRRSAQLPNLGWINATTPAACGAGDRRRPDAERMARPRRGNVCPVADRADQRRVLDPDQTCRRAGSASLRRFACACCARTRITWTVSTRPDRSIAPLTFARSTAKLTPLVFDGRCW